MLELRRELELGDRFKRSQSLDSLGSEAYGLLSLIKDFVLSVWEERNIKANTLTFTSLILRMTLGI